MSERVRLGEVTPRKRTRAEMVRVQERAQIEHDGLQRLEFVVEGLEHWAVLLEEAVRRARQQGYSWTDIGGALGVARQTAWERFQWIDE